MSIVSLLSLSRPLPCFTSHWRVAESKNDGQMDASKCTSIESLNRSQSEHRREKERKGWTNVPLSRMWRWQFFNVDLWAMSPTYISTTNYDKHFNRNGTNAAHPKRKHSPFEMHKPKFLLCNQRQTANTATDNYLESTGIESNIYLFCDQRTWSTPYRMHTHTHAYVSQTFHSTCIVSIAEGK